MSRPNEIRLASRCRALGPDCRYTCRTYVSPCLTSSIFSSEKLLGGYENSPVVEINITYGRGDRIVREEGDKGDEELAAGIKADGIGRVAPQRICTLR
jgi:hypothetical protein